MKLNDKKMGLTLVELMVSLTVLGMLSAGILSAIMQARRMTEDSIYLSTATAVAQGYIEQIKNMGFSNLDEAVLPTLVNQGSADPIQVSPDVSNYEIGNVATDIVNSKLIDINNTPDVPTDDMRMDIVAYVVDITNSGLGVAEARRIVLRYKYYYTDSNRSHSYQKTIFTIRSEVQTF